MLTKNCQNFGLYLFWADVRCFEVQTVSDYRRTVITCRVYPTFPHSRAQSYLVTCPICYQRLVYKRTNNNTVSFYKTSGTRRGKSLLYWRGNLRKFRPISRRVFIIEFHTAEILFSLYHYSLCAVRLSTAGKFSRGVQTEDIKFLPKVFTSLCQSVKFSSLCHYVNLEIYLIFLYFYIIFIIFIFYIIYYIIFNILI